MEIQIDPPSVHSFAAKMSGQRVDFSSLEGHAWGIQVTIPIEGLKELLPQSGLGFEIPNNIKNVVFLDMRPQENLPVELRTVRGHTGSFERTYLDRLASQTVSSPTKEKLLTTLQTFRRPADVVRQQAIKELFTDVLGGNTEGKNDFLARLKSSSAPNIVIVDGHSDGKIIGEYYPDEVVDPEGKVIQKKGNWVNIDEVVARYQDGAKYAAIIIHGCGDNTTTLEETGVKAFHPINSIGGIRRIHTETIAYYFGSHSFRSN